MDPRLIRAWWFARQGLDQPRESTPAEVLERTGWARSVGGANPYLSLFMRAELHRETVDRALQSQDIHELPSARGCTYVVPKAHYALALSVGLPEGDAQDVATAKKYLGVTEAELEKLEQKIIEGLAPGPADPRELKETVGAAARSLGEEGKKRGSTTTLPMALGRLQGKGLIRRISTDGRLDNQRYKYALWEPSPMTSYKVTRGDSHTELARQYFKWIGPATAANFQRFSGLGVKAAKDAIAPLHLAPIEPGSEFLLHPEDVDAFRSFVVPKHERIALVGSIDGLVHLRRDLSAHLDPQDKDRKMQGEKGLVPVNEVFDLTSHGIFDRGRLIGLWEYDTEAQEIVWMTFGVPTKAVKNAIAKMETFIRDELGDARSFSLDSPASRRPKLEFLRSLAK